MKKRCFCFFLLILLGMAGMAACKKNIKKPERNLIFRKFQLDSELLSRAPGAPFAVSEFGEVYLAEDGGICRYGMDGELLGSIPLDGTVAALCLRGDMLYFYEAGADRLCGAPAKGGETAVVAEGLGVLEVRNFVAAGDFLYMDAAMRENSRTLVKIHPEQGTVEVVETAEPMEQVCAVYGSSDGTLYYCTKREDTVFLYAYGEDTGKSRLVRELAGCPEAEAGLLAFAYEKELLAYATDSDFMVVLSSAKDEAAVIAIYGTTTGKDMVCVAGNIVYQGISRETKEPRRGSLYLGEVALVPLAEAECDSVTVCHRGSKTLLVDARIMEAAGIRTKYIEVSDKEYYDGIFLEDILAGNPEIDLCLLEGSSHVAQVLKRKGAFVPLNSSEILRDYQAACFPYIAQEMETENGELWMLPIGIDAYVLWYVEENLEKFGISTEQFATMDSFITLARQLRETLAYTKYRAYTKPAHACVEWVCDYNELYCDFAHGLVDYKTEVFYDLFVNLFDGWQIYANEQHPYFVNPSYDRVGSSKFLPREYDRSRLLYKYDSVGVQFMKPGELYEVTGWRAAPVPRLSEELEGNRVRIFCLMINPYSRKKELALRYLEEIAQNPLGFYGGVDGILCLLFEDMAAYGDYYDFSEPAMQDLYRIFQQGTCREVGGYPYLLNLINEYQSGRLTLTEAVEKLQRVTEKYLKE